MKRQIRQRVFETNSSSTHSICIAKNPVLPEPPDTFEFRCGDFGWEVDKYSSIREKANYLYTGLGYLEDLNQIRDYIQFIKNTLKEYGVEDVWFGDFRICWHSLWDDEDISFYISPNNGYIDHGEEIRDFVKDVCSDKNKLLSYLFSEKSFILTGNDNDGLDVNIKVDYEHDEYYKGN